jgi:hypothetical protein
MFKFEDNVLYKRIFHISMDYSNIFYIEELS